MKSTRYYQVALERLATHLGVEVTDASETAKGWVTVDLRDRLTETGQTDEWLASGFLWTGGKKLILAQLVIQALGPPTVGWEMTVDEVADVIKLTGVSGRDRGLKAHQWQSLQAVLS